MTSTDRSKGLCNSLPGIFLLLLCGCMLSFSGCSSAAKPAAAAATTSSTTAVAGRGVWFWNSSGANGSGTIVGDATAEAKMIVNLKAWGITTVYGSYSSTLLNSNPAALRAWNAMLAANGMQSYVLLSNTDYFLPEYWAQAQAWIDTNFINFNAATSISAERFVGLALDVEPDSFAGTTSRASWSASTTAGRRVYLECFLNFLQSTRALLNENSGSSVPIETAIAYWYATLNSTIGWADQNDVNEWFAALGEVVNRVSVMDYFSSTQSVIQSRFLAEANLLPAGTTTIALRYIVGSEWTSFAQFWQALLTSESTNSLNVDIEDYDTMCTGEGV